MRTLSIALIAAALGAAVVFAADRYGSVTDAHAQTRQPVRAEAGTVLPPIVGATTADERKLDPAIRTTDW